MMKALAYEIAAYFLKRLFGPAGRCTVIARSITPRNHLLHMSPTDRHSYQFESVALSGESHACASGANGLFVGHIKDTCVFERYSLDRQWSPDLIALLTQIHAGGRGSYIDIGANIGLTVIPIAANCRVPCIAIEAEPTNFRLLKANLALNGVDAIVEAHNFAAFSHPTQIEIELSDYNFGDHHIRPFEATTNSSNNPQIRIVSVDAKTLDSVIAFKTLPRPISIKIDTQGSEPLVMDGASELLKNIDILILEIDPKLLARMHLALDDVFKRLKKADFSYGFYSTFDTINSYSSNVLDVESLLKQIAQHFTVQDAKYIDLILFRDSVYRECMAYIPQKSTLSDLA